ncbi:MAG: RNA 2',3'-cyclic phosphodiesterase [Porticoccus sp.]
MSEHLSSKRLFIALPISPAANHSLDKYCQQLNEQNYSPKIRYTPANNRHLTLAFLGQLSSIQVADATEVVQRIQYPLFHLQLTEIRRFPDTQSRIITAVPEPSNQLRTLQDEIYHALQKKGFPSKTRPFRPHITLARMKYNREILSIKLKPPIEMMVSEVILYESQLAGTNNLYIPREKTVLNQSSR